MRKMKYGDMVTGLPNAEDEVRGYGHITKTPRDDTEQYRRNSIGGHCTYGEGNNG
jgi:hypothetical protein